jgi:putative transcriptional regulator
MRYSTFANKKSKVNNLVINKDRMIRKEYLSIGLATVLILLYAMVSLGLADTSNKPMQLFSLHLPVDLSLADQQGLKVRPSKGKFLVASRKLLDPQFSETVVLLLEYHTQGAMGLIINRPTELKLSAVFPDIKQLQHLPDTIYLGGPVSKNQLLLLIRTADPPEDSRHIFEDIYVSSSQEVIQQMIETSTIGQRFRLYAGYAGWGAWQLDHEIWRGGWHVLQADAETVFDKSAPEIWPALIQRSAAQWVSISEK